MRFASIAVVGIGLVGGSFALASRKAVPDVHLYGIDVDESALHKALTDGVVNEMASPAEAVEKGWLGTDGADLVVLATPASAAEEWMQRLGDAGYRGVVTDVASTKARITRAAEESLGPDAAFVGGHPMAGSEQSGIAAARADLFDGAYYVLTPTPETDMNAYRCVHSHIASMGARVISVDAAGHDEAVAIISHVPHVTASALVELAKSHAGESDELLRLAAGGFKDTTRIAAGSAELWTGICLDNADALVDGLEELQNVLDGFALAVKSGDAQGVRDWLAHAAEVRRSLPAQWVPATEALSELLIPVIDRPGVISEVTTAVGRAGCNIEAIEIDHVSEASAVLVLVLTDEGDVERLLSDLESVGYEPRLRPLEDA